jgi:hypothetical protein
MQSKLMSFVEAWANVIVGIVVSYFVGLFAYGIYDIHVTLTQNLGITAIFTVASLVRSYFLRRCFNAKTN